MMRWFNFNLTSDFRNTSQAALEAQWWSDVWWWPRFDANWLFPWTWYWHTWIIYDLWTTLSNASYITISSTYYVNNSQGNEDEELIQLTPLNIWEDFDLILRTWPKFTLGAILDSESPINNNVNISLPPTSSTVTSSQYTTLSTSFVTWESITMNVSIDLVDTKTATVSCWWQSSSIALTSNMISAVKNFPYLIVKADQYCLYPSYLTFTAQ